MKTKTYPEIGFIGLCDFIDGKNNLGINRLIGRRFTHRALRKSPRAHQSSVFSFDASLNKSCIHSFSV
jgi:hypothetical protein